MVQKTRVKKKCFQFSSEDEPLNCMPYFQLLMNSANNNINIIYFLVDQQSQMSVRPYVHPSTKCFFDFNEIWFVDRGRRVMHDGTQYDLIQGQDHDS